MNSKTAIKPKMRDSRNREASFTLFEVIIAIAIMSTMLIELVAFEGNVINFSDYGMNATKATWLAKRVMSQVEYNWQTRPWSEMKVESNSDIPFEGFQDFSYKLTIKEWKLPLFDSLLDDKKESGGLDEAASTTGASADALADGVKQKLGDDLLKVAHVDVSWPEGAKRNSISLTLLLTNQKGLDDQLALLKNDYEELLKSERAPGGKPGDPAAGSGGAAGTQTGQGGGTPTQQTGGDLPPPNDVGDGG